MGRRPTPPVISGRRRRIASVHRVWRVGAVSGSATSVTMPVVVISIVVEPVVMTTVVVVTVVVVTVVVVPLIVVPIMVPFFMVPIVVVVLSRMVSIIPPSVRVPGFAVLPLFCFLLLFVTFCFFQFFPRFFLYDNLLDWWSVSFDRRPRSLVNTNRRLGEVLGGLFLDGGARGGLRRCGGRKIDLVRGWGLDGTAGSRLHVVWQSFFCRVFSARNSCLVLLDLCQGLLLHVLLDGMRDEGVTELVPHLRESVKATIFSELETRPVVPCHRADGFGGSDGSSLLLDEGSSVDVLSGGVLREEGVRQSL